MKIGDLVKWKNQVHFNRNNSNAIGVIIEVKQTGAMIPDYRNQDSFLILWPGGFEWTWKSEIRVVPESQSI